MKEAGHKRVHTVWFHLYEVPKQAKHIDGRKKVRIPAVCGVQQGLAGKACNEVLWGYGNGLHSVRVLSYTSVHICQHLPVEY